MILSFMIGNKNRAQTSDVLVPFLGSAKNRYTDKYTAKSTS